MKKPIKWTLIGLGIFVLLIIVVIIIFFSSAILAGIIGGISYIAKDIREEFTPETKTPTSLEETTPTEEAKKATEELETLKEDGDTYKPTINLEVFEGLTKAGDIYFVRIEAIVTGKPSPKIKFNRDDSKGAFGENIAQVNLFPYAGYLLKATATNSEGKSSTNILLIVDDKGNLIKADKNISEDLIIDDLSYIKILCSTYTDDADPEDDGISIDISFYDSKSEHIDFEDIPSIVNIKIYATEFNWDTGEEEIIEPAVYEGNVKIDHSMRLSEMFGKYIRVPYEDFGPLPDKEYPWGKALVTVITPLQGAFKAEVEIVSLAPY